MKKTSFVLCTLVSAFSMQGTGIAADKWDFVIAPYLLAPNIDGKASIGRVEGADVDVGTTDRFLYDTITHGLLFGLAFRL